MNERPTSLTIIGWLLIVFGVWGMFSLVLLQVVPSAADAWNEAARFSTLSKTMLIAMNAVGGLLTVACGYGVLKGMDWSRLVYIGWSLLGLVIGFLTSPFTWAILASVAWIAVIAFFLFRPAANRWFGKSYVGGNG
ncbi:hypothetical protein [Sphingomicrobium flavum]|uniref:hypothetical protein n=1 Tax=Sphingomicrobium flavum TaxID=1229164 RepID=UPI0021AE015E|nr:hypothetical protein [Sphingomicrobium flavum]